MGLGRRGGGHVQQRSLADDRPTTGLTTHAEAPTSVPTCSGAWPAAAVRIPPQPSVSLSKLAFLLLTHQGRDDIWLGRLHLDNLGARPLASHDPHEAARHAERISKRSHGCGVRLAVNSPRSDSNNEDWWFRITVSAAYLVRRCSRIHPNEYAHRSIAGPDANKVLGSRHRSGRWIV